MLYVQITRGTLQLFLKTILRTHNLIINNTMLSLSFRSSCPGVFCKEGVLRNFVKFTRKHLCQSLFIFLERCFPVNFAKFLRTPFLTKYLRWLLLRLRSCSICLLLTPSKMLESTLCYL